MNADQMNRRCPNASVAATAALAGWRFIINRRGVATLVPEPGAVARGVVWNISDDDEGSLDVYEGVATSVYSKRTVVADLDQGDSAPALVYLASDEKRGVARPGYLEGVVDGARMFGLPCEYIEELEAWPKTDG